MVRDARAEKPGKRCSIAWFKFGYARRIVQAAFLALVVFAVADYSLPVLLLWRLDPLMSISATLAGEVVPVKFLVLAAAMLGAALFLGRAFCGWVCPLGFIQDMVAFGKKKNRMPEGFRYVKYALLAGGLVLPVLAGWTFLEWFSPLSIIPRAIAPVWVPWEGMLAGIFIFVVVVALAAAVEKRAWCRHVCPLGAALSIPSAKKLAGIEVDAKKCKKCLECEKKCTMGVIDIKGQLGLRWDSECVACLACRDACPEGAIGPVFRYRRSRTRVKGGI